MRRMLIQSVSILAAAYTLLLWSTTTVRQDESFANFAQVAEVVRGKLEKQYSISFGQVTPHITFDDLLEYDSVHKSYFGIMAKYWTEGAEHFIAFDFRYAACDMSSTLSLEAFDFKRATASGLCLPKETIRNMSHELGHMYAMLREQRLEVSWLSQDIDSIDWREILAHTIAKGLITEGIGRYFEHAFDAEKPHGWGDEWFARAPVAIGIDYYKWGFGLIKPILDISLTRGIDCLVKHPLNIKVAFTKAIDEVTGGVVEKVQIDLSSAVAYRREMIACTLADTFVARR